VPRIHGELLKLGIDVGETSVGKYMVRHRKPPSQTWRRLSPNASASLRNTDRSRLTPQCLLMASAARCGSGRAALSPWRRIADACASDC
jgi:hypothetical protein